MVAPLLVSQGAPSWFPWRTDDLSHLPLVMILFLIGLWDPSLTTTADNLKPLSTSSADTMEFHCKSTKTARPHRNPRMDFVRSASRTGGRRTTTNRLIGYNVYPANYRKFHPDWMETFQAEFIFLQNYKYYFYYLWGHIVGRPTKWI